MIGKQIKQSTYSTPVTAKIIKTFDMFRMKTMIFYILTSWTAHQPFAWPATLKYQTTQDGENSVNKHFLEQ